MRIIKNFIAGHWVEGDGYIENLNPSDTSDIIGYYAQASLAQAREAVSAARQAQKVWAMTGIEARASVLDAIGEELMRRREEIGRLLSREEGKPLQEGIGEVYRAGQFFKYYAGECLRNFGDIAESVRAGVQVEITREPLGVVGVISPWNFPVATAAWKIAPALAFGNAVLWKPANLTPATGHALAEIISRQAIPPGLFNFLMGSGTIIGQFLASEAQLDGLSFTGSCEVGAQIALAAAPRFIKLQMEMGSKNPLVVMDDAVLDHAVTLAIQGAFGGTGQKCTASSRLIVHASIYDAFVEQLISRTKSLKVGHALEPETEIGPVVSREQLAQNIDYIELARREGGEIACGGAPLEAPVTGYYMSPAVILNTSACMRVNQEEMFAPITCLLKADDFEHALALANDTRFGLTAGIVTRSLARAMAFKRASRSGCVMINLPTAGTDYHVPFGGIRGSSYGPREQGHNAVEFYTQIKTTYLHAGQPE